RWSPSLHKQPWPPDHRRCVRQRAVALSGLVATNDPAATTTRRTTMLDHRVFIGLHSNLLEGKWWKMGDLIKVLDELEERDTSEVHEAHVLTGSTLVFEPDHGIEYGVMDSQGFPTNLGDSLQPYLDY